MLVFYTPICFPNEDIFFKILDIFENAHIKMVEVGIPVENAYLDGQLIRETNKEILAQGLTQEKIEEILQKINENYSFKVVLMTYKEGIKNFSLDTLPKNLFDGILCVDMDLQIDQFPNKVELIGSEKDFSKINEKINEKSPFVYLASAQTTGSQVDFQNASYKTLLPKIRKMAPNPVYVGFGIKTKQDVEIVLENGADGAVIGSELLKQYNENSLPGVASYVNSLL